MAATPEEKIRQYLICHLTQKLGYPSLWMAIEKELAQLPHIQPQSTMGIVKRRADILVFAPHSLSPLLLIECKATPLSEAFIQQVIGYNALVKAPFVSLANGEQVLTGCYNPEQGKYCFENGLPHFSDLINLPGKI